ncbi:hypothetical protein HZB01_01455 [Candidatus Woesearchaeota archaeon]|nr:hypothetical protein [Candidatus Woesearchaeota archaeon]
MLKTLLISGVLLLVIVLILTIVISHIIRWFFAALSIVLFVLLLICAFVAYDAYQFSQEFPTQENLFVVDNNGEVLTAFVMQGLGGTPAVSTQEEIQNYQRMLADNNFTGDWYKIIVFDYSAFAVQEAMDLQGITLSASLANALMTDKALADVYPEPLVQNILVKHPGYDKEKTAQSILKNFPTVYHLRAALFSKQLMARQENSSSLVLLLNAYRAGNVRILPETISFKSMQRIPASWMEDIFSATEAKKEV